MFFSSLSLSSFGYITGNGTPFSSLSLATFGYTTSRANVVGDGSLINNICIISGGNVVRDHLGRLFYIDGLLCSYSIIDGFIQKD